MVAIEGTANVYCCAGLDKSRGSATPQLRFGTDGSGGQQTGDTKVP